MPQLPSLTLMDTLTRGSSAPLNARNNANQARNNANQSQTPRAEKSLLSPRTLEKISDDEANEIKKSLLFTKNYDNNAQENEDVTYLNDEIICETTKEEIPENIVLSNNEILIEMPKKENKKSPAPLNTKNAVKTTEKKITLTEDNIDNAHIDILADILAEYFEDIGNGLTKERVKEEFLYHRQYKSLLEILLKDFYDLFFDWDDHTKEQSAIDEEIRTRFKDVYEIDSKSIDAIIDSKPPFIKRLLIEGRARVQKEIKEEASKLDLPSREELLNDRNFYGTSPRPSVKFDPEQWRWIGRTWKEAGEIYKKNSVYPVFIPNLRRMEDKIVPWTPEGTPREDISKKTSEDIWRKDKIETINPLEVYAKIKELLTPSGLAENFIVSWADKVYDDNTLKIHNNSRPKEIKDHIKDKVIEYGAKALVGEIPYRVCKVLYKVFRAMDAYERNHQ